jgi:hypothetical protein
MQPAGYIPAKITKQQEATKKNDPWYQRYHEQLSS